jgi:uncharacterized protein (TIGR03437 family)
MKTYLRWIALAVIASARAQAQTPVITLVANAEGEQTTIAPNTWVEIKGQNLSKANDTRVWQSSDFLNNQLPASLDGISVTVNGKSAFVYYISPAQVNILTPPDAMQGPVNVVLTRNGAASAPFAVEAQALSPSFFVINGGPYIVAQHGADNSLVGPSALYPGQTSPAKPGETVVLYGNGFGPTSSAVVSGAETQGGTLSPLPSVTVGGLPATVNFAGLISPGLYQINVVIPAGLGSGDQPILATYKGAETGPVEVITVQGAGAAPTQLTLYAAPNGNDAWSGRLPAPNSSNTDGPVANFERARAIVRGVVKTGLTKLAVEFRGGTYYPASTITLTSADSGTATLPIVYQNYPGETPVFTGGVRVTNWTNMGGNTWKAMLPASTQYFENLFYNGVRRLRPRLGAALGTYYRVLKTIYLNTPPPPAAAPNPNCSVYIAGSGWQCFDRFQYGPFDPVTNSWKNLAPAPGNPCNQPAGNPALTGDIALLIWEQFSTSKLRISCIDGANRIVYLTGPTGISQANSSEQGFIAGNRYIVDNVQDALSLPGQWFLDHSGSSWTLTYLANPGENPNTDTVIIPQLSQVFVASGVQYVALQGLTFEHDNYTLPPLGHVSSELEADISAAVSFQNSQHITVDSTIVTQTSGSGLEIIPCLNNSSPAYCVSTDINAQVTGNVIQNSAFYDIGALGIRIGNPFVMADTDANVPQLTTVQNNVVEGYGRLIPASFGIGQGMGHDNLYTHNDVYDGYHCAVSTSQGIPSTTKPSGIGNANNVISFNHVYNLLQGIMNDGGSIRIDGGNLVFTAAGNKILNNKVHDVTDASIMDANGYGGHGIYMDDDTGLVDVENNLVYRVSAAAVYSPHGPQAPNQANIIKNNILAFAQLSMVSNSGPYVTATPTTAYQVFNLSNNLFYFDRGSASTPPFRVQGGCSYAAGLPFTAYQQFTNNLYWRTDGSFAADTKAFHVQPNAGSGANAPCSEDKSTWTYYTFAQWQSVVGEDISSIVKDPGFASVATDDYSLPKGSPLPGFVIFDPNQAGRTNPVIKPPAVAPAFITKTYNPAADY